MSDESALHAPGRLDAIVGTGLAAAPDPMFDRFARIVSRVLNVPVALVSLVEESRQVFPGACGLAEPWAGRRETPLSHSFCQHVVLTSKPLIVTDARTDERVVGNLAITDLSVVGYAGMPLTDAEGNVLGSLCAIDSQPRDWTPDELELLADLAETCSDGLRSRIATRRERAAQARERLAGAAADRGRLLLRASVALAGTSTVTDVVGTVRELVTGSLDPDYVGVSLLDPGGRVSLESGATLPARVAARWDNYSRAATTPSALAVSTGAAVLLPDRDAVAARAPDAVATFAEMGWQAGASVPLPGPHGPIGALTFVWKQPYVLDEAEQAVLAALAGYVSRAVQRAEYLYSREQVAALLQRSMLSDLPDAAPFELAARYEPAVRGEHVGGDWYDAVRLPGNHLALVVGDVAGHDMRAAARMGQLRSMLRAYLADRQEPPSVLLRRLDNAMQTLGDRTMTTAVLAYVQPHEAGYRLQWANAGHPAPLLVEADGTVSPLAGRDVLLGVQRRSSRTDHTRVLPPGATVLLYTDGLIETRTDVIDERKRQLREALRDLATAPLPELLDKILARFAAGDHEDDIAMLAIRSPLT
ncbi:serine phosphatase RsbU (regulator of sigma subunit) [Actinoplanes octamycinicus]|uniref:protein-serine/threonine phosphatase n=1 Tax=Actinoplanes octamycinicus TaxID=135948 RepID=A0A7W7H1W5_9ACTN|nr:SpoIIE family protein phosphatase [Actinoplanes octamycinicus]MBB4742289.1 serine phosphatase RsbU (regulator of sigma subunit) [Actinoplanes octamycinicus]